MERSAQGARWQEGGLTPEATFYPNEDTLTGRCPIIARTRERTCPPTSARLSPQDEPLTPARDVG